MRVMQIEAKDHVCPTMSDGGAEIMCRGAYCMAWRYDANGMGKRRFYAALNEKATTEQEAANPANIEVARQGGVSLNPSVQLDHCNTRTFVFVPHDKDGEGTEAGWVETTESAVDHSFGYCGLAGKPEVY